MKNRIAIIIGRKIIDNIDREIVLYNLLKTNHKDLHFLIPGNNISYAALDHEDIIKFHQTNYIIFNSLDDFERISAGFDIFLIASWRDYGHLVSHLKSKKKKIFIYSEAGGIDFWDMGANILLFKSLANILVYQHGSRNFLKNIYKQFLTKKIITGSLRYEYANKEYDKKINLDNKKLVVFFPKCFSNLRSKIEYWFPRKGQNWYNNYITSVKNHYAKIAKEIQKKNNCLFLVKLHYGYYDMKFSKKSDLSDINFWNQIGVKIYDGDERELFKNLSIGIGVESHSAIDVNYHNKPFIYVKPFFKSKPSHRGFDLGKIFKLKKINPVGFGKVEQNIIDLKSCWLPYWYGKMSDIHNLNECIEKIFKIKSENIFLQDVQKFYWGDTSNQKSSLKILKVVNNNI